MKEPRNLKSGNKFLKKKKNARKRKKVKFISAVMTAPTEGSVELHSWPNLLQRLDGVPALRVWCQDTPQEGDKL
jgi:hypothetical protein